MTQCARLFAGACLLALIGSLAQRTMTPVRGQSIELEPVQADGADIAHGLAILQALRDDLPYVPGEVLVRFKDGVSIAQGESALRVLRATIEPQNGRWIGSTLHLRDLDIDP